MALARTSQRNLAAVVFLCAAFARVDVVSAKQEAVIHDGKDVSLLQVESKHAVAKKQAPELHDHMHLVCHTEGCEEVKAKLAVIAEQTTIARGKLEDCVTTRKKMESDLASAAEKRKEAEIAVAKCVAERTALEAELKQCAEVDRPAAEKGLAQCASERAVLEAELKQCAEIDRPNAEKDLAQCAKDRAELEKKLATLVQALAGGGAAPSSRRRRRKKASLVEVAADSGETDDSAEDSAAEVERLQAEIARLGGRMDEIRALLEQLASHEITGTQALDALAEREKALWGKVRDEGGKFQQILASVGKNEAKYADLLSKLSKAVADSKAAQSAVDQAGQEVDEAQAFLQQAHFSEKDARQTLISLIQQEQSLRHDALAEDAKAQRAKFDKHKVRADALLQAAGRDEVQCDELRAQVVTAQGKLEATEASLKNCLDAKKVIAEKIELVEAARAKAEEGLETCVAAKAVLRSKIASCHEKRDAAREKLAACLDRKKELKSLIEDCHTRRDDARTKLAQCLAKKEELKGKIAAAEGKLRQPRLLQESVTVEAQEAELQSLREQERAAYDDARDIMLIVRNLGSDLADAQESLSVSDQEDSAIVRTLTTIGSEIDALIGQIAEENAAQAESENQLTSEEATLHQVLLSLKEMGAKTDAAMAAALASDKAVEDTDKQIQSM